MIQHKPEETREENELWAAQLREELAALRLRQAEGPMEALVSPPPAPPLMPVRSERRPVPPPTRLRPIQ